MSVKTPRYLGVMAHPAVGIRIPRVFLPGILAAYKKRNVAGGLMLSYGRETAPQYVIDSPAGTYEITMGHTGTSIREYLTLGAEMAAKENVVVEMEADHLTVTLSSAVAVKRISGIKEKIELTEEDIERSIQYIASEVEEAVSTGYVNFFTLDTCELIDYRADRLTGSELEKMFYGMYGKPAGDALISRYVNRRFKFIGASGKSFSVPISRQRAMQLALKYGRSLEAAQRLYSMLRRKVPWEFGIEIAFDETREITRIDELLFYLRELWELGIPVDYIAPNVGFEKKQDFKGDIRELERNVEAMSAVAEAFGALLCFHSGSGSTPYSGKGPGVYEALKKATSGNLKYKISGIYYELLMELLASYPAGSPQRSLYENIYEAVIEYLEREIERGGPLSSSLLRSQLKEYRELPREKAYDPRNSVFRYYSFLALNMRSPEGNRIFRDGIIGLYLDDKAFGSLVDREVEALTLRLIDGLGFTNNTLLLHD